MTGRYLLLWEGLSCQLTEQTGNCVHGKSRSDLVRFANIWVPDAFFHEKGHVTWDKGQVQPRADHPWRGQADCQWYANGFMSRASQLLWSWPWNRPADHPGPGLILTMGMMNWIHYFYSYTTKDDDQFAWKDNPLIWGGPPGDQRQPTNPDCWTAQLCAYALVFFVYL